MFDDSGVALAAEYVVLLGVSLLVFSAVIVGFQSFAGTASADATSASAYRVAAMVGERISAAAVSGASSTESVDLPERICGHSYLVVTSDNGRKVSVLVGRETFEAPIIAPDDVRIVGFMISVPGIHRIDFEPSSKTLTMT
jgi:hypothetical protein